ncbi:hypothetical protein WA158_005351 [Blastocystis sp. Blastoise]
MNKNKFWEEVSEVIIGDPVNIREDILTLWLDGLTESEANDKLITQKVKEDTVWLNEEEYVKGDVRDSYRVFNRIQQSIINDSWMLVELTSEQRKEICNRYFHLDNDIIKEILFMDFNMKKRDMKKNINESVIIRYLSNIEILEGLLNDENIDNIYDSIARRAHISAGLINKYLCILFIKQQGISFRKKYKHPFHMNFYYNILMYMINNMCDHTQNKLKSLTIKKSIQTDLVSVRQKYTTSIKFVVVALGYTNNDLWNNKQELIKRILLISECIFSKGHVLYFFDDIATIIAKHLVKADANKIENYFKEIKSDILQKYPEQNNTLSVYVDFIKFFVIEYQNDINSNCKI